MTSSHRRFLRVSNNHETDLLRSQLVELYVTSGPKSYGENDGTPMRHPLICERCPPCRGTRGNTKLEK